MGKYDLLNAAPEQQSAHDLQPASEAPKTDAGERKLAARANIAQNAAIEIMPGIAPLVTDMPDPKHPVGSIKKIIARGIEQRVLAAKRTADSAIDATAGIIATGVVTGVEIARTAKHPTQAARALGIVAKSVVRTAGELRQLSVDVAATTASPIPSLSTGLNLANKAVGVALPLADAALNHRAYCETPLAGDPATPLASGANRTAQRFLCANRLG